MYRDVIHEDRISVQGKRKSPDYSFRVGGTRKFFIEAKKPAISIKNDREPAFQLRRYGWSGKLPVSILTNFEELAIYSCTLKPSLADPASRGRIRYYTYGEYEDKWDEIEALFSKEAVLRGSFDRFADTKKRGTITVDEDFLSEIENWRRALAGGILKLNNITTRNLNYAVQIIIDRIIFLRICEDRGIEEYGRLEKLKGSREIYKRLISIFKEADERYNSGLFHFNDREKGHFSTCDNLTPKLKVEDAPLRDILASLYFPNPYEFSVIPADILGQVYERFLGKVINVSGKKVQIEEKPEVKKAGGVYYTPTHVVDYIVEQTVEKLLEGKDPKQVAKLRILDPACGSGSFLIVAYQRLLDWHLNYYNRFGDVAKFRNRIQSSQSGKWHLTTGERKRILLANIFGVDIDSQAVEVTKLSLLLKVLEGESSETINHQLKLFHERALPDVGSNIKCGNSLVSNDFYRRDDLPEMSEEDHLHINAFDWGDEFREVFKSGGFDAVIGNPPYIFARGGNFTPVVKDYFMGAFKEQNYQLNTYPIFMERGINLLRKGGMFGYITPNNWLTISTLKRFRDYIISSVGDLRIVSYQYKVFDGANVDTATVTFSKSEPGLVNLVASQKPGELQRVKECSHVELMRLEAISFGADSGAYTSILEKMNAFPRLITLATVKAGLMAYEVGKGRPAQTKEMKDQRVYHSRQRLDRTYRRYLDGKDVRRYELAWSGQWLKYGENLAAPRKKELYEGERILVRQIPGKPPYSIHATLTCDDFVNDRNSMIMRAIDVGNTRPILGLLNSTLLSFWFNQTYQKLQRGIFPQFKVNELEQFPMAISSPLNARLAAKVNEIMVLVQTQRRGEDRINNIRIKNLNAQLDALAYKAFGITENERQQIEEAVG